MGPGRDGPFHVIAVAGPPGAGKGTVCDRIHKGYGLVHISPGQLLRDHIRDGSPLGQEVATYVEQGRLVPTPLIIDLIRQRLSRPDVLARGCVLDNFPLTAEQAEAMEGHIDVERLILLQAPDELLAERALGRSIDPQTGRIYHSMYRPAPADVQPRLARRSDDRPELVAQRLQTHHRHMASILPFFEGRTLRVDASPSPDAVWDAVCAGLDTLEWTTESAPYFGNGAFNGPFEVEDAVRAGFYSPTNPPDDGDPVCCFQRGRCWQRRGRVVDVAETTSDGHMGLRAGEEGAMVTVECDDGSRFKAWSAFLAPVNDKEYSAICGTHGFLSSTFAAHYRCGSIVDAEPVSKAAAREALAAWLRSMVDSDQELVEVSEDHQAAILTAFDSHDEAALYLYTTHQRLGPRVELNTGHDYSLYYRALNNTLNADTDPNIGLAIDLIQRMVYLLLYREATGERRLHAGGRVWKGDVQRPVPLNMHKLREAHRLDKVIRFRQFQSTTSDEHLADKYMSREDGRGYKWIIDIPPSFWGARDIHDISWKSGESETLFPCYAAFRVKAVDDQQCHLLAVERSLHLGSRAERHGLRGSGVELLNY